MKYKKCNNLVVYMSAPLSKYFAEATFDLVALISHPASVIEICLTWNKV